MLQSWLTLFTTTLSNCDEMSPSRQCFFYVYVIKQNCWYLMVYHYIVSGTDQSSSAWHLGKNFLTWESCVNDDHTTSLSFSEIASQNVVFFVKIYNRVHNKGNNLFQCSVWYCKCALLQLKNSWEKFNWFQKTRN